jgi:hypothetical protein
MFKKGRGRMAGRGKKEDDGADGDAGKSSTGGLSSAARRMQVNIQRDTSLSSCLCRFALCLSLAQ